MRLWWKSRSLKQIWEGSTPQNPKYHKRTSLDDSLIKRLCAKKQVVIFVFTQLEVYQSVHFKQRIFMILSTSELFNVIFLNSNIYRCWYFCQKIVTNNQLAIFTWGP